MIRTETLAVLPKLCLVRSHSRGGNRSLVPLTSSVCGRVVDFDVPVPLLRVWCQPCLLPWLLMQNCHSVRHSPHCFRGRVGGREGGREGGRGGREGGWERGESGYEKAERVIVT